MLVSISANKTRSLRGAVAHIAKTRIKYEDDLHESDIKKGEKFYLKKLGKRHYLIDVEQEGGKDVWYQFPITEKEYAAFVKKHPEETARDRIPKNREKRISDKKTELTKGKSPREAKILSEIVDIEQEMSDPLIETRRFNSLDKKLKTLKAKLKPAIDFSSGKKLQDSLNLNMTQKKIAGGGRHYETGDIPTHMMMEVKAKLRKAGMKPAKKDFTGRASKNVYTDGTNYIQFNGNSIAAGVLNKRQKSYAQIS